MNRKETIIINGATSIIGKVLLLRLIEKGALDKGYYFFIATRPSSLRELRDYIERVESLYPELKGRYCISAIEVTSPGWDLSYEEREELYQTVSHIIHLASIRENKKYAFETNTRGIETTISLARRCKNLKKLIYVSSVFINGDYRGRFYEDWLDIGQNFPNKLNRSFYIAEKYLRALFKILPINILRIGFIINDIEVKELELYPCCDREIESLIKLIKRSAFILKELPNFYLSDSCLPLTPLTLLSELLSTLILKKIEVEGKTFCIIDPSNITLDSFILKLLSLITKEEISNKKVLPFSNIFIKLLASFIESFLELTERPINLLRLISQRQSFDIYNTLQLLQRYDIKVSSVDEYLKKLLKYNL